MEEAAAIMERLRMIARDLNISGRQFSISIGQSNSYLATVPTKGIRSDVLTKIIIKYPQYNINWLLTGKGEMLNINDKILHEKLEKAIEEIGYYKGIIAANGIEVKPFKPIK